MELKPCPFCGGSDVDLSEKRLAPRMDGKTSALVSATVRHWCARNYGIVSGGLQFTGRTVADAVAAWNRRA